MHDNRIYIKEVQRHQHRWQKLINLTHSSTKAAGAMLLAAVAALVVANTAAHEPFLEFWHTHIGFFFGDAVGEMSLAHVINDVFMAVFFLLVGLEVKYELTVGELTNIRQALLPIMAAVGGVLAPIGIYLLFNAADPATAGGWGVPTATDIAFALGILALLGNRVPAGVRVFLSTLAVADDIIAILVIAIFYGQSPSLGWLAAAAAVLAVLVALNRGHVYSLAPYLLVGAVLWYCVYMSGVHSTIAGVLLAFAIPSGSRVNLRSFATWSDTQVREASRAYDPDEPVLFQEAAKAVARGVQSKEYERGIAICGTGMGVSIICNKHRGVYAALCESIYQARRAKVVNNTNVLCMGGFIIGNEMGREMARAWLEAEHMVGLDPEMARIVEKEFDELVEFENEMYGDVRQ